MYQSHAEREATELRNLDRSVSRRNGRLHRASEHGSSRLQRPVVPTEPHRGGTHWRTSWHPAMAQLRSAPGEPASRVPAGVEELRVRERSRSRTDTHTHRGH